MIYNIGQRIVIANDYDTTKALSDEKITVKAGTKVYVAADLKWPHIMHENGDIQPLSNNSVIEGFSTVGISEWLYTWLNWRINLGEMLGDYDLKKDDFTREVQDALEELGMYDNTGNRS